METMTRQDAHQRELELQRRAVADLLSDVGLHRWAQARRHHRSRSMNNQLLIAVQMPQARFAFTFRQWLGHGYCVKKGETAGAYIWQPKGTRRADGTPVTKKQPLQPGEKARTFFGLAAVFGEFQVQPLDGFDGERLDLTGPPPPANVHGNECGAQLVALQDWCKTQGRLVIYPSDRCGAALGFYDPLCRSIHVKKQPFANAEFRTLVHELCHALIHEDLFLRLDYATEEMVVESATRLVGATCGLDLAGVSDVYASWWALRGDLSTEVLTQYAKTIHELASQIEDALKPQEPAS